MTSITIDAQVSGFTLIELITTLTIVGLLSAVGSAKYINLSSSANIAKLHTMLGTVRSAVIASRTQAIVEGVIDGSITVDGNTVIMKDSYPTAQWGTAFNQLIVHSGSTGVGGDAISLTDWCTKGNISSLEITGATTSRNLII